MGSIGETLKAAREQKGISLQQAEEDTKIRKRYLEALEDGDYDVIPGRVYVKGFLRNYASYLGLNPDEILMEFKLLAAPVKEEFPKVGADPVISNKRKRDRSDKKGYLATVIIAVLAILTVIIYNSVFKKAPKGETTGSSRPAVTNQAGQSDQKDQTGQKDQNGGDGTPDVPSSVYSAPQPGTTPAVNGQSGVQNSGAQNPGANGTAGQTSQNTTGVNLTIIGKTAKCWTQVTVDGVVKFAGTIKPGETKTFSGTGKIVVTYGNAGGVEVIHNGQNLGAPGKIDEVVRNKEYLAGSGSTPAPQGGAGQAR